MKQIEITLFKKDCYTKDDYRFYCDGNEIEFDETNDSDYYAWLSDQENLDFEEMLYDCMYSKLKNCSVLVEGSVGTWRGRFEHKQTTFPDFKSAIYACMGRDCEISKVVKIGNRVDVTAIHHDGRNYHSLYFLTPLGECRFEKNGKVSVNNRENIVKLPRYMWE
jgi:hypothetical protein